MNLLLAAGLLVLAAVQLSRALPLLEMDGFGWAENLCFDGLGSLFVSEMTGGKLHRIWLNDDGQSYNKEIHLDGFKNIGGLAVSGDGKTIYAAVTFADKTNGIVSTPTSSNGGNGARTYSIVGKTSSKPNGMQLHLGTFWCTEEGGVGGNGSVFTVDLATGKETLVHSGINADGAWINPATGSLFVGQVKSMNVAVFDIAANPPVFKGNFPGPSSQFKMPGLQLLDDLTLAARGGESSEATGPKTELFGADWLGKRLLKFTLDGSSVETVTTPKGVELKELTSVRWGKGPGFDANSVYVSEGGGLTEHVKSRRIVQIPIL